MNDTSADTARQDGDLTRYSMMVSEAVAEFERQDLPTSERSVQRYCADGRLSCIRIDPDTRQPTDTQNSVYLIDPASIPERIRQMRERTDFSGSKAEAAALDTSGHVEAFRDETHQVASSRDTITTENERAHELEKARERIAILEKDNHTLTIDKGVRDGLITQLREDREKFFTQMERFTEQLTGAHRTIGKLESELLALRAPETESDSEAENAKAAVGEKEQGYLTNGTDNPTVGVDEDGANSQQGHGH